MNRLYTIPFSPWSEKASWALDHHRVEYKIIEFVPILGLPALRLRARGVKRLSIPTLIEGDGTTSVDSFVIAKRAETLGSGKGAALFTAADVIAEWNARSESIISHGREIFMPRIAADPEACYEATPKSVPMRRLVAGISVRIANYYIRRKYKLLGGPAEDHTAAIHAELVALRAGLAGREFLLGGFSYADIAMAAALQIVDPVKDEFKYVAPALRRAIANPALAAEFADLLTWRDGIYARHRRN